MPLEQIRPVLRLNSETSRRPSSLLDYDDDISPANSPDDELGGRNEWLQGSSSGLRRTASTRKAEGMSLAKLGGVGGVTRSGSWGRGSLGGQASGSTRDLATLPGADAGAAKLHRSPHPLSEEDYPDLEADAERPICSTGPDPSFPGRRKNGSIGGSTTSEAPSSSSRASTSSSSAAAFSLRSLSNRNSTGSVSSTASSTGSFGNSAAGGRTQSQASDSQSAASPATPIDDDCSETNTAAEPKADCDSVSDCTDVPQRDAMVQPWDALLATEDGSQGEGHPGSPLTIPQPLEGAASASVVEEGRHDVQAPALAPAPSVEETRLRTPPPIAPTLAASMPANGQDQTPVVRPSMVLRMPSADALNAGCQQQLMSDVEGFNNPAEGSAGSIPPLGPPAPRKHSGRFMLRSRSQLASQVGLQMSFANGGHGRAAARDRSRQPIEYENAPFSVLEARRHAKTDDALPLPESPRLGAAAPDMGKRKCSGPLLMARLARLTPLVRPEHLNVANSSRSSSVGSNVSVESTASNAGLATSTSGLSRSSPDCSDPHVLSSVRLGGTPLSAESAPGSRPTLSRTSSIQGTNVFRTPTMEEWSRFLESQGVSLPSGRHSRTATNFSAASAQQLASRLGSSSRVDLDSDDDLGSDDSDDDLTAGVLEKLRQIGLSRAASHAGSVMGEDLASLHEAEEEDLSLPDNLSPSSSDPLALFMPSLGSRRDSPLPSPGLERSPVGSPTNEATPQPSRDRLSSLRSPTGRRWSSMDVLTAEAAYDDGERGRKTINDYIVMSEVGRGAYGLVKRARARGPSNEPTGEEVIIKYIIKSRILADCWRRHRILGPIPIEIHVMDQLRRLPYHPRTTPLPWSPYRPRTVEEYRHRPSEARSVGSGGGTAGGGGESTLAPAHDVQQEQQSMPPPITSHPNLCKMLDFFEDHEFYYMVMPRFGTGQDLFDYVESAPDGLDTFEVRSIFGQVADALRFLHANNIVHRDIKDENVILDGDGNVQLIDFGSAAHVRPSRLFDTFSGTLDYAAAEILRGEKYAGQAQDVWALGVVAFVLLCGECPFWNGEEAIQGLVEGSRAVETLRERNLLAHDEEPDGYGGGGRVGISTPDPQETSVDPATWNVARKKPHAAEQDGGGRLDDVVDLIARCLEVDPALRPTTAQICQHRFLAGQGGWTGPQGWTSERERSDNGEAAPAAAPPG